MIVGHALAALTAAIWSARYFFKLRIRFGEVRRYFTKSSNLALCYCGFASQFSVRSILGAGKAGFLCCAYDVVTDWRGFASQDVVQFQTILSCLVRPADQALAMDLLRAEESGQLSNDGLSRGPIALRFVSNLMGICLEPTRLGILFQIVDDVIDFEEDLADGQMNCLNSNNRVLYLRMVLDYPMAELRQNFPYAKVLISVIQSARKKAGLLLGMCNSTLSAQISEDFQERPADGVDERKQEEVACKIY